MPRKDRIKNLLKSEPRSFPHISAFLEAFPELWVPSESQLTTSGLRRRKRNINNLGLAHCANLRSWQTHICKGLNKSPAQHVHLRGPREQVFVRGVVIRGPREQVVVRGVMIRGPREQVVVRGVVIR